MLSALAVALTGFSDSGSGVGVVGGRRWASVGCCGSGGSNDVGSGSGCVRQSLPWRYAISIAAYVGGQPWNRLSFRHLSSWQASRVGIQSAAEMRSVEISIYMVNYRHSYLEKGNDHSKRTTGTCSKTVPVPTEHCLNANSNSCVEGPLQFVISKRALWSCPLETDLPETSADQLTRAIWQEIPRRG